jgi:hypothetical protein
MLLICLNFQIVEILSLMTGQAQCVVKVVICIIIYYRFAFELVNKFINIVFLNPIISEEN